MAFAFLVWGVSVSSVDLGNQQEYVDLPCAVDTTGLGLVESGLLATRVEANDQRADTERPHATTLRIPLLHAGDVFGDVLDRSGILDRQPVTLGLQPRLVDEDAGVGVQAGEGQADVVVHQADFGGRDARIL